MCYVRSSLWLFHSSVQHFPASNALDPNRVSSATVLIQRLAPQAGASVERPAEAKPALAPASPPRAARQGAVSSPRRCPNPPLLGSMWHKLLKAAAWTLAFLQPP